MSVEQLEQDLLKLGSEERKHFAEWFFEHQEELLGEDYIHPEVKAEILERREEALAHPERLEDLGKAMEDVRKRFDESRSKGS